MNYNLLDEDWFAERGKTKNKPPNPFGQEALGALQAAEPLVMIAVRQFPYYNETAITAQVY